MDTFEERRLWLLEWFATEDDVLEGKEGEFIFVQSDNGEYQDGGYAVETRQVYLPTHLQKIHT